MVNIISAQDEHINIVVVSVLTHCWHVGQSSAVQFISTVEAEGKSLKIIVWIPVSYSLFVQERQKQRMCQHGSPKVTLIFILSLSICLSPFPSILQPTVSFSPWSLSYCLDSRGTRGIPHAAFRCCSLFSCADELPAQPGIFNVSCHLLLAFQARHAYRQNSSSLNLPIPLNLIEGEGHTAAAGELYYQIWLQFTFSVRPAWLCAHIRRRFVVFCSGKPVRDRVLISAILAYTSWSRGQPYCQNRCCTFLQVICLNLTSLYVATLGTVSYVSCVSTFLLLQLGSVTKEHSVRVRTWSCFGLKYLFWSTGTWVEMSQDLVKQRQFCLDNKQLMSQLTVRNICYFLLFLFFFQSLQSPVW